MFQTNSRYLEVENAVIHKDGRNIQYKTRRFLPKSTGVIVQEMQITKGDRLDNIAARIIGDPEQFWRICDSNNIMHPLEITKESGRKITITRLGGQ